MSESKAVLIVDDDEAFIASVQSILGSAGYRVLTASDGRQAYALASSEHPDLVLLDVVTKEQSDVFLVLRQLRETPGLRNTPVILVSSIYTELPSFELMPDEGKVDVDLFLPKPLEPEELLREVARLTNAGRDAQPHSRRHSMLPA